MEGGLWSGPSGIAGGGGDGFWRTRTATPAQRMTATPPMIVVRVKVSPSRSPAQQMLSTGWMSWTWLTRAIGPMARPRYQAKKPRNMLTTPR